MTFKDGGFSLADIIKIIGAVTAAVSLYFGLKTEIVESKAQVANVSSQVYSVQREMVTKKDAARIVAQVNDVNHNISTRLNRLEKRNRIVNNLPPMRKIRVYGPDPDDDDNSGWEWEK